MFNKNIKLVLFIACIAYAIYQFIESYIGNGIMFVLIGLTFLFLYYKNEFILLAFLKLRKQDFAGTELIARQHEEQWKIVLPQALATVVPSIMNTFIGLFKDTSLVTIVSLYELTGALGLALNSDADWRPFKIEAYLFIAAIYFVFCFAMSRYSLWIEKQLARSTNR